MSKPRNNKKEIWEMILLIGVILLIPLFFAIRSLAQSQAGQPAAEPTKAVVVNPMGTTPTANGIPALASTATTTSVAHGKQPPACTFPLAIIPKFEAKPVNYIFLEPQIVLKASESNIYTVIEWLPDNRQLLMTEQMWNKSDKTESINLFDSTTGKSMVYANRDITYEPPSWQSKLNAVVYPVKHYTKGVSGAKYNKYTNQLWLSYGNPSTAQKIGDDLSQLPLAIKPDGNKILYFTSTKISQIINGTQQISSSIPFDSSMWDYATRRRDSNPISFEMAWQPASSLVFLYSDGGMGGGGYTFILNSDTGNVCELTIGGWAEEARWSADGKYLAFIRSTNYGIPTFSADLSLLDTITGKLSIFAIKPQNSEGSYYVDDFIWAPDNIHLLALVSIDLPQKNFDDNTEHELFLVDSISGTSYEVVPDYRLRTNAIHSLAWSEDGKKLIVRCPTTDFDQLCLIPVNMLNH